MPIAEGDIISRGNAQLIQGILDRQTVTFGQAFQNAFQATRDQVNLQAGQERNLLRVQAQDRNFREDRFRDRRNFAEGQFRDRRNFDRSVVVSDRNFSENQRQFNANLRERQASRALQRELGFARLSREDQRIGLARDQFELRALDTFSGIDARDEGTRTRRLANDQAAQDLVDLEQFQSRFEVLNDPELFRRFNPGKTEEERLQEVRDLQLEAQSRGFDDISKASGGLGGDIGSGLAAPRIAEIREGAIASEEQARQSLFSGNPREAAIQAAEAQKLAEQSGDPDLAARAGEVKRQAEEAIKTEERKDIDNNKNNKGGDGITELNFRNGQDALDVAFAIKADTGIGKLTITNSFNRFARQFRNADEFRNGIIAQAEREGKEVTITPTQAKNLFNAETFLNRASTPSRPVLRNSNAASLTDGL